MPVRFAAIAAILVAFVGCGGGEAGGGADLKVGTTSASSASADSASADSASAGAASTAAASTAAANASTTNGDGAALTGKLAASLAPPSSVVVLEPHNGTELPVKAEAAIMDQAGYAFLPEFLIAQAGQTVQFRNSEDVLHNVRLTEVSTQKPVFNVATLAFGKYEHKLEPGFYNVTCDIHSTMRASILVTASPYAASTAEDGSFSMKGVRTGTYNLTIYTGAAPIVRLIEVKSGGTNLGMID